MLASWRRRIGNPLAKSREVSKECVRHVDNAHRSWSLQIQSCKLYMTSYATPTRMTLSSPRLWVHLPAIVQGPQWNWSNFNTTRCARRSNITMTELSLTRSSRSMWTRWARYHFNAWCLVRLTNDLQYAKWKPSSKRQGQEGPYPVCSCTVQPYHAYHSVIMDTSGSPWHCAIPGRSKWLCDTFGPSKHSRSSILLESKSEMSACDVWQMSDMIRDFG